MNVLKLNNKNYNVPELNFEHSVTLEQCGIPLWRMNDLNLMFTITRAFIVVVVGCDIEHASHLIEQHVLGGGDMMEIWTSYTKAITDSHFFKKLLENQEKAQSPKKTTKKEAQSE